MSRKPQNAKITTIIPSGMELEGTLKAKGGVRIDGRFRGQIDSESVVHIGEKAEVHADIKARVLFSSGRIQGNIIAVDQVALSLPGSVEGSISTRDLSVEKGVFLKGSCRIMDDEPRSIESPSQPLMTPLPSSS